MPPLRVLLLTTTAKPQPSLSAALPAPIYTTQRTSMDCSSPPRRRARTAVLCTRSAVVSLLNTSQATGKSNDHISRVILYTAVLSSEAAAHWKRVLTKYGKLFNRQRFVIKRISK